jgi:pyruvate,water dikinase
MKKINYIIFDRDKINFNSDISKLIGGKALGLHELKKAGAAVPRWTTLTTVFFAEAGREDEKIKNIFLSEKVDVNKKADRLRNHIKNITFNSKKINELKNIWEEISEESANPVAVRSSAADEDGKALSFAGQMDSFLNVRNFDEFVSAILGCWASLFSERAVLYRQKNNIDPWRVNIAVVIQQMIEAEVSGVIFTANPLNGRRDEFLVNSLWGLGEGLVSGRLDADSYVINTKDKIIRREIAEKKQKVVYLKSGGTDYREVIQDSQKRATLSDNQLKELKRIALKAQDFKKIPLDIEFALKGERIFFLQARPITTLVQNKKENLKIWDNSNISESYSGVTTPLTFSFIRRAYYAVYNQFCETIGVDRKTIFKNRSTFENMLGLIEGRVYYNLLNWYKLVSLMPGFEYNKKFMEQMMGLQVAANLDDSHKKPSFFRKYFIQLPCLVKVGLTMIIAHLRLPKRIREFHVHFDKAYSRYKKMDYDKMNSAEIVSVYRYLEDEVLWKWRAPITNDFEAMIFYGLLKNLTASWNIDPEATLQNDLLTGQGGITSTEVTIQLVYIARNIKENQKLSRKFSETSPQQALKLLNHDNDFSKIKKQFDEYLSKYGVRCINEMKLESVPIKDDPLFCIATIQNYLRLDIRDPQKQKEREEKIRKDAEKTLKEKLRNKRLFHIIPKITVYRWVLNNARVAVKNRENQRFARTEAYSLVRTLIRAIGKKWESKKIIDQQDDIFYLKLDEIISYIEGTSTCLNLKGLIELRKKEFEAYKNSNPDDHIETEGMVYYDNSFSSESIIKEDNALKGLGCCPGIVDSKVQVVLKPDASLKLNNEIMVAKYTDPGWVVLFPSVSGLIIEKGSMLSHSAIVAREMGIPAVVGVKNATRILSTGDRVILDGAKGTVKTF